VWNKNNIANFTVNVNDTSSLYDVVLTVTNNDSYAYANLYMFTHIVFPDKKFTRDTIEFYVANNLGEWTGSGVKNYTNTYKFKSNIRFPKVGEYTFSFEQAMRCSDTVCNLQGVEQLGLSLIRLK